MSKITEDALIVRSDEGFKYSTDYFTEWAKCRVLDYNKNIIGVAIGDTGSGKTWSAIRLGELIDPNFNIDNVVFSASEFLALLNSGRLHKGSVIVYEEVQLSMNKRKWYALSNSIMNQVLSTFRNLNLVVIFTTPDLSYFDSQGQKLIKVIFETKSIIKEKNLSVVSPKILSINHITGKIYFKYMRVVKDGEVRVMDKLLLQKASHKLLAEYELKKKQFNDALNKRVELELRKFEGNIVEETKNEKVLTDREKKVYDLISEGYSLEQISQATGMNYNVVATIKHKIRSKGLLNG